MKLSLTTIANMAAGWLARKRSKFVVGSGSNVRWLVLRSVRGGNVKIGENCIINCNISFDDPRAASALAIAAILVPVTWYAIPELRLETMSSSHGE